MLSSTARWSRRFAAPLCFAVAGLVACQQPAVETDVAPERTAIDTMTFAPALQIDLKQYAKTKSGVYYHDVIVGGGAVAAVDRSVTVRYVIYLPSGTLVEAQTTPTNFVIGPDVIRGWLEGLPGMKVGGVRRLIIPPAMGYGRGAHGPIPGNSTLVFEIELLAAK
jgi:FKBP-type peptidyl-prolyl cis-trans isomerase FkpA